jgi:scyllo-inositol 2-dehydrogenase (NADP+)
MKTKILYVYGGASYHATPAHNALFAQILNDDGRFEADVTTDLEVLARLPEGRYAAVVLYTSDQHDDLTPARAQGLRSFIAAGGGCVGIHSAADSFRNNAEYVELIGSHFVHHPPQHEFQVKISTRDHYLTARVPDFAIYDEMYHLAAPGGAQSIDVATLTTSGATVLAQTQWQGRQLPLAYVKNVGQGRLAYLALGHSDLAWKHQEFQKLLIRAIAWSTGAAAASKTIRCAALGYGGAFNMGKGHLEWINATPGLQAVAMCDADPRRVDTAKQELPGLKAYHTSLEDLIKMDELDLVVDILPHNLHAPTALQCMGAGKHVITEKPFCIDVAEASAMIDAARSNNVMLSTFHNRRWDGDYLLIQDLIKRGLIGEIFHIECGSAGYGHPGFWWRSEKHISGGVMHDWGAHFLDWLLNLVPSKIAQVTGNFRKLVWGSVTNEDHGQAYIRFANGCTVDLLISSIASLPRTKWRIFGSKGAIEADWKDEIKLVSHVSGVEQQSTVKITLPGYGSTQYYRTIADHLLMGEQLAVKPEQARRVIAVIEAAQRSSKLGTSVPVAPGCE